MRRCDVCHQCILEREARATNRQLATITRDQPDFYDDLKAGLQLDEVYALCQRCCDNAIALTSEVRRELADAYA